MACEALLSDMLKSKTNTQEPQVTWISTALGHKKRSTRVVCDAFFPLTTVSDGTELGVTKGLWLCWPKISEGLIRDESLDGEGTTDV